MRSEGLEITLAFLISGNLCFLLWENFWKKWITGAVFWDEVEIVVNDWAVAECFMEKHLICVLFLGHCSINGKKIRG